MNLSWISWMEEGWQWSLMLRSMGALWNGAGKSTWHCFVLGEFLGTCYENRCLHCCLSWVKNGNGGGKGVVQRQGERYTSPYISFTSPDSPLSPSYPLHFPWAMKVCSLSPALQTFFLTMENNSVLPAELKVWSITSHSRGWHLDRRTIFVLHWLQALIINGLDRDLGHPDQI